MAEVAGDDAITIAAGHVGNAVIAAHGREGVCDVSTDQHWCVIVNVNGRERRGPVNSGIETEFEEDIEEAADHVTAIDGADNMLASGSEGGTFTDHNPRRKVAAGDIHTEHF